LSYTLSAANSEPPRRRRRPCPKLCEVHKLRAVTAPIIHATSDYQHTARQHLNFQAYAKSRASAAVSQCSKGTLVAEPYRRPKASQPASTEAQKRFQLCSTAAGFTTSSQACETQSVHICLSAWISDTQCKSRRSRSNCSTQCRGKCSTAAPELHLGPFQYWPSRYPDLI
jgi:hypothetical protein